MFLLLLGIIVGALAMFFILKNNRKRAQEAWDAAELAHAKLLELYTKYNKK
jgi:hypothetical protein